MSETGIACSVIIPTRDHPELLQRCLQALLEAHPAPLAWEALVMDNSSPAFRAANADVTASFRDARLRYIPMELQGLMFARHQGAELARGDLLCFIDDDSYVAPTWFEGLAASFADPRTVLVTGPNRPEFETHPPAWVDAMWMDIDGGRVLGHLSLIDFGGEARRISHQFVWGCNFLVRRSIFEQARGSHPDYLPAPNGLYQGDGESALAVKVHALGFEGVYNPACAIRHYIPARRLTPESFGDRAFFLGIQRSFTSFRREHGLGPLQGVPDAPGERPVGRLRSLAREWKRRLLPPRDPGDPDEVHALKLLLARRHQEGWDHHRRELGRNAALRAYVLRPDFMGLNGRLPE